MIIQGVEIVHFHEEEFTDAHGMSLDLLLELDRLRSYIGSPLRIHESNPERAANSSHKKTSLHYEGKAIDGSCVHHPLWEFFLAATRFKFTGIGVYPHWNNPGLHLEMSVAVNAPRKYWWRDRVGNYRAITIYDLAEVFKIPSVAGI